MIIRIAKEPLTHYPRHVYRGTGIRFDAGDTPVMDADERVTLALGAGYPLAVERELTGVYAGRCEGPEGRIEITSVSGGGDALSIRRTSASSYEIRSNGDESDATMHVRGTFVADTRFEDDGCWREMDGRTELDFVLELTVRSRAVHGVELEPLGPCERNVFFSESTLGSIRYFPLDSGGARFSPTNASPERPVDLELRARDGSELRVGAEGDLPSVRLPASETVVEVAAPAGPSIELQVVDSARVTELEYDVALLGASEPVESGGTIDAAELLAFNRVTVHARGPQTVDGQPVCSALPSTIFTLTSATPATCRVRDRSADAGVIGWFGVAIGAAELLSDGECRLRWTAPTLDRGRGLSVELSATFLHVDALMPID